MKVLTCNVSDTSAKKLADNIALLTGKPASITLDPYDIDNSKFVRYGCGYNVGVRDTQYNSANFINTCISKLAFSNLLSKNKFYTPIFYRNQMPKQFPVLIRKRLDGHAGNGIIICRNAAEFCDKYQSNYYWTPFIKTEFEIRAYVCGDKVIKIFDKVIMDEKKESDLPIRSKYDFVDRKLSFYPKVQKIVSKLSNVISGKIYSLDMAWDANKGDYIIFEGNSGSWMSPKTAMATAEYLVREMKL